MTLEILIYAGITVAIAAVVIGFTVWKSANPAGERPEQLLYVLGAVLCGCVAVWTGFSVLKVWWDDDINIAQGLEWPLVKIGLFAVISAVAFRASRVRAKREPNQAAQENAGKGSFPSAESKARRP